MDNVNNVFMMLIFLFFPLIYWIAGMESKMMNMIYVLSFSINFLVYVWGLSLVWWVLLTFELMMIVLFFMLCMMMYSWYSISTSYYYFVFSLLGSINFIMGVINELINDWLLMMILMLLLPFCIKIPSYPFYYWLPEVHCEANTSISLLLAGLLVKLGNYGMLSFILVMMFMCMRWLSIMFVGMMMYGMIIVSVLIYIYLNLKKMIAFSSILHLNLSLSMLISMNGVCILSFVLMSMSHSLSSTSLFLMVGFGINKTYSWYWDTFLYIDYYCSTLLLFFMLMNLSFIGSLNFVGEIFAMMGLFMIDYVIIIVYLLSCFLSMFFWLIVMNSKLLYYSCYACMNYGELYFLVILFLMNYMCGVGFMM